MRKLKLEIGELTVESFGTERVESGRGTVRALSAPTVTVIALGCDPNTVDHTCNYDYSCEQYDTCGFGTCGYNCDTVRC
jgi:hypothetical protein